MKKLLLLALTAATLTVSSSCSSGSNDDPTPSGSSTSAGVTPGDVKSGTYNGHQLYKVPRGGCYYINSKGNKEYVDAKYCI